MRFAFFPSAFVLLPLLAGCAMLPAAAPTDELVEGSAQMSSDFTLVKVSDGVMPYLVHPAYNGFPDVMRESAYRPNLGLEPGDVIVVSIFEAGSGISSSAPGSPPAPASQIPSALTLPPETIESDGGMMVPFVGKLYVRGRSPVQLSKLIADKLAGQMNQPQVIVSVQTKAASMASVNGEVNHSQPVNLTLRGERLLDAISLAGGPRFPIFDTDVRIVRGRNSSTVSMQSIVDDPSQNIYVRPDDQIILIHDPKSFTVLGATTRVAQYGFDTPHVTLAEAVARAGGSVDQNGDPTGTYLIRVEPAQTARAVVAASNPANLSKLDPSAPYERILYKIDLGEPGGYFYAQNIQIRDKDIVLVTNATGAQLSKFFQIARGATGIIYDLSAARGQ